MTKLLDPDGVMAEVLALKGKTALHVIIRARLRRGLVIIGHSVHDVRKCDL